MAELRTRSLNLKTPVQDTTGKASLQCELGSQHLRNQVGNGTVSLSGPHKDGHLPVLVQKCSVHVTIDSPLQPEHPVHVEIDHSVKECRESVLVLSGWTVDLFSSVH